MTLTTIEADVVIANLLLDREVVGPWDLNEARSRVEGSYPDTFVEVDRGAVTWAYHNNRDLWDLRGGRVTRKRPLTEGYVREFFNFRIPEEVRDGVVASIRSRPTYR